MTTTVEVLSVRLRRLGASWAPSGGSWDPSLREVAQGILREPQAMVDALVEAGVLDPCSVLWRISSPNSIGQMQGPGYRLASPKPPTLCAHCGEEIEPWEFEATARPGPQWRHVDKGQRQCLTLAEPSDA